jgi:hypothetical protein
LSGGARSLTNPVYGGHSCSDVLAARKRIDPTGKVVSRTVLLPREQWAVLIPDHHPGFIDWALAGNYEAAKGYPSLLGEMAVLASMDLDLYKSVKPLTNEPYAADVAIGTLITGLTSAETREDSVAGLKKWNRPVTAWYESLPPQMAKAMQLADTKYTARRSLSLTQPLRTRRHPLQHRERN